MPAYSFGNRWMGIASLTEPPVPPPLHRLALAQHEAMLHRSDSDMVILPGGERIARETTRTALARMGRGHAMAEQWSKSDVCYELGKVLQNQDPPERAWPAWLLRRIVAVARRGSPQLTRRTAAVATPQTRAARVLPHPPAPVGDIPVSPAILAALDGFGWQPGNARHRRAWLAIALIHVSYLHESETLADEISPALLGMLAAVGASWTALAALDLQIQTDPSAEAGEQSKKIAGTRTVLPGAIAALLGIATVGLFGKSQQPPVAKAADAVAMQICGVLVLLGDFTVLGRISARAYRDVHDFNTDTRDWRTDLEETLVPDKPTWEARNEGTDGEPAFSAVVTDARGRTGTGRARSKTEANRLAARDYLSRYHPEVAVDPAPAAPAREPRRLRHPPTGHVETVMALRRAFSLPPEAEPWITQAMLHGSYAYENRPAVAEADQTDNRLLAHHGSLVMEALRAADLTGAVIARTLAPTGEQGRLGTAPEASLYPAFDALGMSGAILRGAGESRASMDAVKAGAVQAMHAVAWRFSGCRLLDTRPAATCAWIEDSDTSLDAFAQLDQLCRTFGISLTCTEAADRRGYGAVHRATITLAHDGDTVSLTGPPASAKPACRTVCAAEVLKRFQGASDAEGVGKAAADPLGSFLLRALLHGEVIMAGRGMDRVISLRLLGLTHLLAGDADRFGRWAAVAERAAGTFDDQAAEAMRNLYIRAVAGAHAAEHRELRSRTRQAARDVAEAIAADRRERQQTAWAELNACQAAVQALTDPGGEGLGDAIASWADGAPSATDAAAVARKSRAAAALPSKDISIIRAVGQAMTAAASAAAATARVRFDDRAEGAVLTIRIDDVDVGTVLPDLLGLAVTVAPRLTWKESPGVLEIVLPRPPVKGAEDDEIGALAAVGLAALHAPAAELFNFAADVAGAVRLLTAAADTPDRAEEVISLGTDPIAQAAADRRASRKAPGDRTP